MKEQWGTQYPSLTQPHALPPHASLERQSVLRFYQPSYSLPHQPSGAFGGRNGMNDVLGTGPSSRKGTVRFPTPQRRFCLEG